jgi:hypothetical protein
MPTITKEDILTTQSRRILFNCLLKGMSIKDAAPQAKLGTRYAQNIVVKSGIANLVKQEMARISEKTAITVELLQSRLLQEAELSSSEGKRAAAIQSYATLLKSIGGFMADRIPDENLAGKALDAKRAEDLRQIAELHYSMKYLATGATRAIEARIVADGHTEAVRASQGQPDAVARVGEAGQDRTQTGCKEAVSTGQSEPSSQDYTSITAPLQPDCKGEIGKKSYTRYPSTPQGADGHATYSLPLQRDGF